MSLSKNIIKNEIFEDESYITTNLVFSFFPISFILGNLVTNINIILFCCLGILHLKSKIILAKIDFPIKVIFIFFLTIIFSTAISVAKVAYFEGYNHSELIRFVKSILFLRFFLLLLIIYLLNKHNILNFNYFFLVAALSALIISLDVIYQYIVGNNIIGLKSNGYNNSSFFGSEYIAGGYIQRFAFFSIFFTTFFF